MLVISVVVGFGDGYFRHLRFKSVDNFAAYDCVCQRGKVRLRSVG